jgi:hypothetical protein
MKAPLEALAVVGGGFFGSGDHRDSHFVLGFEVGEFDAYSQNENPSKINLGKVENFRT